MFPAPITANVPLGIADSQQDLGVPICGLAATTVSNNPREQKGEEKPNRIYSRRETKNARRTTPQSQT